MKVIDCTLAGKLIIEYSIRSEGERAKERNWSRGKWKCSEQFFVLEFIIIWRGNRTKLQLLPTHQQRGGSTFPPLMLPLICHSIEHLIWPQFASSYSSSAAAHLDDFSFSFSVLYQLYPTIYLQPLSVWSSLWSPSTRGYIYARVV